jgi:hypothetical protein
MVEVSALIDPALRVEIEADAYAPQGRTRTNRPSSPGRYSVTAMTADTGSGPYR